jgi:hypothetical protein
VACKLQYPRDAPHWTWLCPFWTSHTQPVSHAHRIENLTNSTLSWVLLPLNIVVLVGFLFLMLRDIWKPTA